MPTLTSESLHPCSTLINLPISAAEAELLVSLLRPRAHLLHELLEVQIQACEPGDDTWADTQDALRVANRTLLKVRNVQVQYERQGQ